LGYNILYKKSVQRDLKKLSRLKLIVFQSSRERTFKKLRHLSSLKGQFAGLRKYRVGDYRVIYAILGDDVLVLRIGHRKEVYKKEI